MGRGWRNTGPKARGHRIGNLSQDAEHIYKKIRRYAVQAMREDYARELFEYRVRYRYGNPSRIHYRWKTKQLLNLMRRVATQETSPKTAMTELEYLRRLY